MKIENLSITLSISVIGDGGYNNKSSLHLGLKEGYTAPDYRHPHDESYPNNGIAYSDGVDVPDPWDLRWILPQVTLIEGFALGIPSGMLSTAAVPTSVTWEEEDGGMISLNYSQVTWDGKLAGLLGGMSGYCSFSASFSDAIVTDGTYMRSTEDFLDYVAYMRRINIHTLIEGYDGRCEKAASFLNGKISRQEWDEYLAYLSGLGDGEAIALSREGGYSHLKADASLNPDGSYNHWDSDIFDDDLHSNRRKKRRQRFEEDEAVEMEDLSEYDDYIDLEEEE